jgi:hypothetical protein
LRLKPFIPKKGDFLWMINRILRANHRTKGKEITPRRVDIMKRSRVFVQAGKVEEKAREPESAIDGPEKDRCSRLRRWANATALVKILPSIVRSSSTAVTRRPPRALSEP